MTLSRRDLLKSGAAAGALAAVPLMQVKAEIEDDRKRETFEYVATEAVEKLSSNFDRWAEICIQQIGTRNAQPICIRRTGGTSLRSVAEYRGRGELICIGIDVRCEADPDLGGLGVPVMSSGEVVVTYAIATDSEKRHRTLREWIA